jgi:peroxiredoxin Q/BCP
MSEVNNVAEGSQAPNFRASYHAADDGEGEITLSELQGRPVLLAFYPKDDTPGCTKEMCAFRDDYEKFSREGAVVYGISRDTLVKHRKFADKYDLASLPLISDEDGSISQAYGVGETYKKRTSFLIDPQGKIAKIVEGMPKNEDLLEAIRGLRDPEAA